MDDFKQILLKIKRKISCLPQKLPPSQIRQQLKTCQNISSVNAILKYCNYDDEYMKPSATMSLVILKRIIIIINGPWKLTGQDWKQIKNSFEYIHKILNKSERTVEVKWQIALILVLVHSNGGDKSYHHTDDMLDQLTNTYENNLIQVSSYSYYQNIWHSPHP